MSENNRNSIEKCRKRLPQFTTMNVIDGQAGLVIYSSLIFYSLTIDNILNIIVLLILAGVSIAMLTSENGILKRANEAVDITKYKTAEEKVNLAIIGAMADDGQMTVAELKTEVGYQGGSVTGDAFPVEVQMDGHTFTVDANGVISDKGNGGGGNIPSGGISSSEIANAADKSEYYGATVNGYTCTNSAGVNNWKIFYADENNIYLIADDYIHYDYCPPSATQKIYKNSDYKLSMDNVVKDYTGSASITDTKIQNLNKSYFEYLKKNAQTSTNNNMKAVGYMTDTNVWKVFAGEKAEYAIGGPTIEMLMKSYSQKYGVNYQARAKDAVGYEISKDGVANWANYYSGKLKTEDSLYVISSTAKANAMWVASPSANGAYLVVNVGYDGSVYTSISTASNIGFRPLVSLQSDIQLQKNADGTYTIL